MKANAAGGDAASSEELAPEDVQKANAAADKGDEVGGEISLVDVAQR